MKPCVFLASVLSLASIASFASESSESFEEESSGGAECYVGVSGALTLPQGGSSMRRIGGGALRVGRYFGDFWALEGEAAWLEDAAGLGVDVLWHLQGWSLYGDLFGYSRFDPFLTAGVRGWIGGPAGQVGPSAGVGTYWHLTEEWSLRFDANATLGLDSAVEVVYTLSAGVQRTF